VDALHNILDLVPRDPANCLSGVLLAPFPLARGKCLSIAKAKGVRHKKRGRLSRQPLLKNECSLILLLNKQLVNKDFVVSLGLHDVISWLEAFNIHL